MKFDFSSLTKNKNIIILVLALVIVCGGSYLGVKTLSDNTVPTTVPTTIPTTIPTTVPTTVPTTIPTTAPTTEPTTIPTTAPTSSPDLMTTFPISGETPTTVPTTVPTTAPTTDRNFTLPSMQLPSPSQNSGSSGGNLNGLKPDGVLFDEGMAGFQFNKTGNYYYTNTDPWQRTLGYNEMYDNLAAFTAIFIDTMRCKFRYDNKDWMVQFWKGQYGYVFIGHEIGVYYKPIDRTAEHYDCVSDADSLYMEMNGMRDGEVLYHRDYGKYWWCTEIGRAHV